jgi:serine protease Do
MRQGGWVGVMALAAGLSLAGGTGLSYAAPWGANAVPGHQPKLYAAAMGGVYGYRHVGYLGVVTRDVNDEEVATLKLKDARGVEVVDIDHDGPACKAGMQTQDVILQMDGQMIGGEEQLRRMLRDAPAGRKVSFVISRDGQSQTMTVQMADRKTVGLQAWEQHYTVPDPGSKSAGSAYGVRGNGFMSATPPSSVAAAPKGHRDFLGVTMILNSSFTGAQLELMGPQLAQYFGADNGAGLLVRSVDGNSPADLAGMKAGDVVVRINSLPIANGDAWTRTVHDNRGRPVPVVVIRDKHEQTLTLTPDGKKRSCLEGIGLEKFFAQTGKQTKEQTWELLAKL